jgi:signal peptidase II
MASERQSTPYSRPMPRPLPLALGLAALVVAVDQPTKIWASRTLAPLGRNGITVIAGYFSLSYAENTNAAFGILHVLPYDVRQWVLTGFALAAAVVLVYALASGRIKRPWTVLATGLILGGDLGNVIDRLRLGHVVDFIVWHIGEHYYWPTFNIADSAIVVGVFILLWISYYVDRQRAPSRRPA